MCIQNYGQVAFFLWNIILLLKVCVGLTVSLWTFCLEVPRFTDQTIRIYFHYFVWLHNRPVCLWSDFWWGVLHRTANKKWVLQYIQSSNDDTSIHYCQLLLISLPIASLSCLMWLHDDWMVFWMPNNVKASPAPRSPPPTEYFSVKKYQMVCNRYKTK